MACKKTRTPPFSAYFHLIDSLVSAMHPMSTSILSLRILSVSLTAITTVGNDSFGSLSHNEDTLRLSIRNYPTRHKNGSCTIKDNSSSPTLQNALKLQKTLYEYVVELALV